MAVRGCRLVAIDGTHASGKTTLIHALVAHYRSRGNLVDCTGEPARSSPFIEETVIYKRGEFDLAAEVDLFAVQLTEQLRAARHQQLLICDKTIINVLAYARMFLSTAADSHTDAVLDAMGQFCRAWSPVYDLVFYCTDLYDQPTDPFREKVAALQVTTDRMLRDTYANAGLELYELPSGLSVHERVQWVAGHVDSVLG
jgi:predicted ATPase